MKTRKLLVILSATALLSSCGLYNKYERPEVNTQGLVRDPLSDKDTLVAADTANFGNMPWKEVFTDPQLQQLIQQGLDHNTDLLNAALNVKMMQAQLMTAKLAFIPAISFSPSGTLSSWNNQTPSKIYSLPVQASWSIDLFGNLLSVKRSAQMQLLAMKDYQTMVKTNIISGIANVYYTLLMLDKQQQIVDEMVGLTEETWNVMKLQKELGRARSTSVQSAEASHYMVKAQAADLKRQIKETENALCLLLGQPGQKIERGNLESQSLPTTLSAGVPLQLLNNRADVHYAEMQLAACYHDVQTARSRFYPSITISGSGAFTNSGGMGIVNPGKWLLSAVGSLTQPIFMNGRLVAGLKVAKAQQEQAYNTWQNAILKAGNEVSNALVAYNTSAEKAELEAKQVALYTQTVADTRQLYTSSGASYLEVISAQSNLLNAQLSKVADEFYKMQAVVSLYSALGGGRD
ncbi:MAG: efflux transporter outer membrane subunit [Prevotella sp.]|nr:efflux transporter outer membrane subunit [Prevotella sp.]MCI5855705.1 efflux transporter outer membrane subunit [Prevotella sp.]MDD6736912.1 efflux transporter outer membrane subunit [Prevotella sp.]MDY6092779.1 efflux transporter outer membrane subunit [Prevotella sp.]